MMQNIDLVGFLTRGPARRVRTETGRPRHHARHLGVLALGDLDAHPVAATALRDPGLPLSLLPPGWMGVSAGALFNELNTKLSTLAREHALMVIHGHK